LIRQEARKELNKMLKKKAVVKYQNGEIIKGWIEDFRPERESFILFPLIEYSEEERLEINFESLKAVFFVKDFIGDKNYKKVRTFNVDINITPSQRKLIVNFKNGEHLYGTSHSYGRYKIGFFAYPIDPKDNSERIFVVRSAVENVRLMKIEI
jgi:small nuclear ribonucleoprotein (snRNP)-like protein